MLKKSKSKMKRRNTEPNVNLLVIDDPSNNVKTECTPVDQDVESEPF